MPSRSVSQDPDEPEAPFRLRERVRNNVPLPHQTDHQGNEQRTREGPPRPIFHIGGSVIQPTKPDAAFSVPHSVTQQTTPVAASSSVEKLEADPHADHEAHLKKLKNLDDLSSEAEEYKKAS